MPKKNTSKAPPTKKKAAKKPPAKKSNKKKSARQIQKEATAKRCLEVVFLIEDSGFSLRKSLKVKKMSSATFFDWTDETKENAKQYARACALRADALAEEIFDIADDNRGDDMIIYNKNGDEIIVEDKEYTSRAKLRIDVRKWHASKLNPKKYGDKVEVEGEVEVVHKIIFK